MGIVAGPVLLSCRDSADYGRCVSDALLGGAPAVTAETQPGQPAPLIAMDRLAPAPAGSAEADSAAEEVRTDQPVPALPGMAGPQPSGHSVLPLQQDVLGGGEATVAQHPAGSPVSVSVPEPAPSVLADGDAAPGDEAPVAGAPHDQPVAADTPAPAPSAQPASPDTDVAEQDTAQPATPEQAAPAPGQVQGPDDLTADPAVTPPSMGLVRVEPDGLALIAGGATPHTQVEIFANDEQIGTETAGQSGDWVFVPAAPLVPGGVELRVRDAETGLFGETSVVVVVAGDLNTEPLVVASSEGEASQILQGLPRPNVAPDDGPSPQVQSPDDAIPAQPAGSTLTDGGEPAHIPEPTPDMRTVAAAEDETPAGEGSAITVTAQESVPAPPALPYAAPSIDAIEIDQGQTFFAGGGAEDLTVRLYVDNEVVADTGVNDGRWLVEAGDILSGPQHRVRVDMLSPAGVVVGRAEVDFILDVPTEDTPPTDFIASRPDGGAETASSEPGSGLLPSFEAGQAVVVPPASDTALPAPVSVSESEPDMAVQDNAQPVTGAPVPSGDLLQAAAPIQSDVGDIAPAPAGDAPVIPAPEPADASAPATIPTLVGVQSGDRIVSGRAIIRTGDNLWTIARRVYGEGVRYTQIYQANADQIRNPHLIYPGQVFDLPETDLVIGLEEPR